MSEVKAVLFDLDGTLRDTRQLIYESLDETFRAHGLRSPSAAEMAPYIHHHSFVQQQFAPDISFEDFESVYRPAVDARLASVQLYDGAQRLLAGLKEQGYKVGIVTAALSAPQDVKDYGIDVYLDTLVSANDITAHKPDPEGMLLALQRLNITASEAMYVGDMATDIRAGKAAHLCATVGITHGLGSRESLEETGADYIIDSLSDLWRILEDLAALSTHK